jgi:hypothetical protein
MEGCLMGVHSCYFNAEGRVDAMYVPDGKGGVTTVHVQPGKMFRHVLENSPDYYIFITTTAQEGSFNRFLEQGDLKEFLFFDMGKYITNGNYPEQGRKLKLTIFKGRGTK